MEHSKQQKADGEPSEQEQDSGDVSQAKSGAGDALGQTIVTSQKIVIDEKTGKVVLAESSQEPVDPQAAAEEKSETLEPDAPQTDSTAAESQEQPAKPEPADAGSDVELPPAKTESAAPAESGGADEEAAAVKIPAAQTVSGGDQTKSHKRLSAQTLFEFALPETVKKSATADSQSAPGDESDYPTTAPPVLKQRRIAPAAAAAVFAAVLIAGAAAYFGLFAGEPSAREEAAAGALQEGGEGRPAADGGNGQPPAEAEESESAAREEDAEAGMEASVESAEGQAGGASMAAADIDTADLSSLSSDELLLVMSTDDEALLDRAVREAATRSNAELSSRMLELRENPNMLVRVSLAKALALPSSHPPEMRSEVVAALKVMLNDSEYLVRGFSAKALGSVGGQEVKEDLQQRLAVEENKVVSQIIEVAIDQLERRS